MSFVVLLFFFGLLAYMFLTDSQGRFIALVMGTVLFPTTALIIKNPSISPQHIFLYAFFFIEFFKDRENFNRSISNNLLIVPIAISVLSYLFTAIYNSGIASKDMYYGLRDIVDCFGYIYAAFICGQKEDVYKLAEKLMPFVIAVCLFGIAEILLGDNHPYKLKVYVDSSSQIGIEIDSMFNYGPYNFDLVNAGAYKVYSYNGNTNQYELTSPGAMKYIEGYCGTLLSNFYLEDSSGNVVFFGLYKYSIENAVC